MKPINIVFVKYPGVNKSFLFEAPLNITIADGQKLQVETMYGDKWGVASGNNIYVSQDVLNVIVKNTGAYFPLKKVTGFVKTFTREEVVMFQPTEAVPF